MGEYDRLLALARSDPQQFQKLLREAGSKVLHPHPGQIPVLESDARFKVMNCGRRFGKTLLAAKMCLQEARKPNQMIWWVAPTYRIVKRGYSEGVLPQLPGGLLKHPPPPDTNFDAGRQVILRFKNGSKIEFHSAERPEGMLGAGVDFVVLDEAATMSQRIWHQIISPTLIDRRGKALLISTPRGRNWFYRSWLKGQDADEPLWASWTYPTTANPTLADGEAERMRADMPSLEAAQEIDAKFVAPGSSTFYIPDGSVQHSIIREDNFIEGVPPRGYIVLGIDLARSNDWTVIYGARARDRRNCYFERMQAVTWPEQKRRIRRAVARLMRTEGVEGVTLVIDETGVGDPIVEDLEADGYDVVGINFTTHKNNMVRLLAKDLEMSRAFVLRDAQLIEFENYTMKELPSGRWQYSAPEGEHDDVVAAKLLQHHGIINEGVPEVTTIGPGSASEEEPQDPWDVSDDDGFSDLIDDDEGYDLTPEQAAEAVGLDGLGTGRVPTTQELINRPDSWF